MDDLDDLGPLAVQERAELRARIEGLLAIGTDAIEHAARLAEAGESEAAHSALVEIQQSLKTLSNLTEACERYLEVGTPPS